MTDRERWQLRGSVRSCNVERKCYSRRCGADTREAEERGDFTTVDFRSDGKLSRQWHRNPDGSESTSVYEYNDREVLIQVRSETAGGIVNLAFYEYDNDGRLLRVLTRHGDADRVVETYEYDTSGRKTKTLHVDVAAQRSDTTYAWGVEGTDTAYSAQGTASLTTTYNERDQPARLSFRNLAGGELSRVEFRYDDAGRLVEEVQRNVQDFLPRERLTSLSPAELKAVQEFLGAGTELTRCTHVYDEQGRRVETCSIIGPLGCDRTAVTFNQYGDPIVSVTEDETNDFEVDEQGRLVDNPSRKTVRHSETRFRYEYDSEGNWLSKVVESRPSGEDEFSVSTIEQRTITYFV